MSILVFWGFTYILFSYRAQLRYGPEFGFFDFERVIMTGLGSALLFGVLRRYMPFRRVSGQQAGLIVATVLPASLILLGARLLFDYLGLGRGDGAGADIRWVTVWAGYFGLWVSATLALRMTAPPVATAARRPAVIVPVADTPIPDRAVVRSGTGWAVALDWLALEMARLPDADRATLAARLAERGDYEIADEYCRVENEANEILRSLGRALEARSA